jgi:DNA (cytosine-5)-methyltransferase 1
MKSTKYSVKDAAIKLALSPQQVRNLCRGGKMPSTRVGHTWVLEENDVIDYFHKNSCGVAKDQAFYKTNNAANSSVVAEDKALYKTNNAANSQSNPIALSFFSGAMGLDLGLERAGFEVLLACEFNNACRKTILRNKPNIALLGDIAMHDAAEIRRTVGLSKNQEIDLVIGGPPCQAFSTAGNRQGFADDRGNVLLTFLERIIELRPKFAVIENVRGILSAPLLHRPHIERGQDFPPLTPDEEKGGALMYILDILKKAGYGVSFNLYNAANFGSPQKRERVIIVCSRNGKKLPHLIPTHSENGEFGLPKWRTFREAIRGLPKQGHHHLSFPEKRLVYYRMLKPGQYWRDLPEDLQKKALGASYFAGGGKTGFLRRLAWDKPSPTLVTHPAMPATDLAHPTEDRPLSIEEYRSLQEFPDDWIIEGSLVEQYKQIGNAVPASLGQAVGTLIINYINGNKIKQYPDFPYSRYINTDEVRWENEFKSRSSKQAKHNQLALAI